MLYVCEVCEKIDNLTEEDAFDAGWDYPPFIGTWGVISPRTCGDCGIQDTVWWEIVVNKVPAEELSERHLATIQRIIQETN